MSIPNIPINTIFSYKKNGKFVIVSLAMSKQSGDSRVNDILSTLLFDILCFNLV